MAWTTKPPVGTQLNFTNPINYGLVGCWIFNEDSGTVVNDLSGNGNNGTLTNFSFPSTTTSGWNPGRLGPAIAFDGTNDFIAVNNNPSLNLTTALTISAWVNPRVIVDSTYQTIITKGAVNYAYPTSYSLHYYGGAFRFHTSTGAPNQVTTNGFWASINTWYHVVLTYNAGTVLIYVNGVQQLTTTSGTMPTTLPQTVQNLNFSIPADLGGVPGVLGGLIDEVRIWNRVLTNAEINTLYVNPYGMFLEGCPPIMCSLEIT